MGDLAKCAVVFSIIALIASVAKILIGINEDTLTSNRDEKAQNAAVIAGLNTVSTEDRRQYHTDQNRFRWN